MSTEEPEPGRRIGLADVFQGAGLLLVTVGVVMVDVAAGVVAAGLACLWIGWSRT